MEDIYRVMSKLSKKEDSEVRKMVQSIIDAFLSKNLLMECDEDAEVRNKSAEKDTEAREEGAL